jgi:hypothetical protein
VLDFLCGVPGEQATDLVIHVRWHAGVVDQRAAEFVDQVLPGDHQRDGGWGSRRAMRSSRMRPSSLVETVTGKPSESSLAFRRRCSLVCLLRYQGVDVGANPFFGHLDPDETTPDQLPCSLRAEEKCQDRRMELRGGFDRRVEPFEDLIGEQRVRYVSGHSTKKEYVMGFIDKAKQAISGNKDKVKQGIDKTAGGCPGLC